jgi:hypothetical protein
MDVVALGLHYEARLDLTRRIPGLKIETWGTRPISSDRYGLLDLHGQREGARSEGVLGAAGGVVAAGGGAAARTSRAWRGKVKLPPVSSMTLTWQM